MICAQGEDQELVYSNRVSKEQCTHLTLVTGHGTHKQFTFLHLRVIVQELCESRGGRTGLFVLTSLLASVDVKIY